MDTPKFPDEILLLIVHYLGAPSTHDLRDLALVSRKWYLIAAPILLSTIAVSSLSDLVQLCDHIASVHRAHMSLLGRPAITRQPHVSMIVRHARSLVISGTHLPVLGGVVDCYTGLDRCQPVGNEVLPPDIEIPYDEMISKLDASIPHLKHLESFEWYGRFPGDYYLAVYLLKAGCLSRLTLCIDKQGNRPSQSYGEIALGFERLTSVNVEVSLLNPLDDLLQAALSMLRRNCNLERITLHFWYEDILTKLISGPTSPNAPFIWSNLRHLELRSPEIRLWDVAEASDVFARFLVAHPLLQTIILYSSRNFSDNELPRLFSLASYPNALPNLQVLRAPLCIIAGIVESQSAAASLVEVNNWTVRHRRFSNLEELLERTISSFESVSDSPLRRLTIQVPEIDYDLFMRLSKCMPNLAVLELDRVPTDNGDQSDEEDETDQEAIARMAEAIPSGLNLFPKLQTIGCDIASYYSRARRIRSPGISFNEAMEILVELVPALRSVHIEQGILFMVGRDSSGVYKSAGGVGCLHDVDVGASGMSFGYRKGWKTRPKSKKAEELYKQWAYVDAFIRFYEPDPERDLEPWSLFL
ncbi:hypothetical protein BDV93DRAFT_610071 [Ceratobasidium sp. AG-I]|nr:hypothetical protein BDV93DRAFT_610071 [Ceratobasidium sp. AG-I]